MRSVSLSLRMSPSLPPFPSHRHVFAKADLVNLVTEIEAHRLNASRVSRHVKIAGHLKRAFERRIFPPGAVFLPCSQETRPRIDIQLQIEIN